MPGSSVLRNRFLRSILILSIVLAIALVSYKIFFINPSFTKLLVDTTEADAVRITRHLASSMLISHETEIRKDSLDPRLSKEIDQIKEDFELMNLKVFSPSGKTVFSANPNETGEINQSPYFRDIVSKGKVHAKMVPKDKESLEGQRVTSDVLELYVPLMNDGRFLGAFEIYYDVTDRRKQLEKVIKEATTIMLMFASGLLIAILFIVRQENIAMKKRRQLEEERLQREKLQGVLEMAGAACHELNQPLQVLSVYSYGLLGDLPEDSPLSEKMKKMKEEIDHLGQITIKIMNVTRYETKEYIEGNKIIDIDKASLSEITQANSTREERLAQARE